MINKRKSIRELLVDLLKICLCCLLPVLTLACATQPTAPENTETVSGIWVNTEYSGRIVHFQKIVIDPVDLMIQWCYKSEAARPDYKHPYTIMEKWTDSEGDTWYKIEWLDRGNKRSKYLELSRISQSGMTLELVNQREHLGWPTKLDTDHPNYRVYYREK